MAFIDILIAAWEGLMLCATVTIVICPWLELACFAGAATFIQLLKLHSLDYGHLTIKWPWLITDPD